MNLSDLIILIEKAKNAYYNGSSIMSDDEYDALLDTLSALDPSNKLLANVGADPASEWKKEKHLYPLGSLNKANSIHELTTWINKISNQEDLIVLEKLDGLSIGLEYKEGCLIKALLRGNALEGENIIDNVLKMQGVKRRLNDTFTGILRGEILLHNDLHNKHFINYANPRNAASGICRRLDGVGCEYLTLYFYQVLGETNFKSEIDQLEYIKSHGLLTPNYYHCTSINDIEQIYRDYLAYKRESLQYWIDGLVVSCNKLHIHKTLGELNFRPRAKIALKFPNKLAQTVVTRIDWQVGNSGRVTPVAYFKPIDLQGSRVEKASLYNIKYIKDLNVGEGATILVCKANEIIPRVEKTILAGTPIAIPTQCPACQNTLIMQGENLQCLNTDICQAQIIGRIKNWINTLNILEWGDKLLLKLVENKLVNNITDLYKLSVEDLSQIDRMGERSAAKCHATLWQANPVSLENFLGGLSVPLVGASTIQMLINDGLTSLEDIRTASYDRFLNVKGLGPNKAESLFKGLRRNAKLIDELLILGVKITQPTQTGVKSNKLNGKVICITGPTNIKRGDLAKLIEGNGGVFKSSISKDCTHLIVADLERASKKLEIAHKYNIILLSENQFFDMIG